MIRYIPSRQALACVFFIFCAVASSSSQTNTGKTATGSISGKVTVKNKGVAGVFIIAHEQNASGWNSGTYRGTTDQTGSYRIANIPAGTYLLSPIAPSLAVENALTNNMVVLSEGEAVEGINFQLVQGGVITGKVTDADGKPVIEEYVAVQPVDASFVGERYGGDLRTDDRGIYRAFGLRRGKYKVSVGREAHLPNIAQRSYGQTFHPSVTDAAKATIIEVTEGSETRDVDIVVGRPLPTFKVSGRIVHGKTEKPLPNIRYGVNQKIDQNSSHSTIGRARTTANGEFTLENIVPGKYAVFIVSEDSGFRGDSVSFEVVDRDVSDLLIKAGIASTLSGVVVLEGAEAMPVDFRDLHISAWVQSQEAEFDSNYDVRINPDGSFKLTGLRNGITHFRFSSRGNTVKQIALVRVERDGIAQPQGITLKDGEQITGLRLVLKYLTGAIHGQVKVEGDELLPSSRLNVWIAALDDTRAHFESGNPSPQLDSRRRFVAEGLAAGTYEVNVSVYDPKRPEMSKVFKQQVTVVDNAVSEVTVVIKTKP